MEAGKESDSDLLNCISDDDNPHFDEKLLMKKKTDQLLKEIEYFKLTVEDLINSNLRFSTKDFWRKYGKRLPILNQLAKILMNVPASSAFIERFFSICGIVCKQRAGNSDDDLVITRSLLKANLDIINSFNEYSEEPEQ